MLCKKMAQALGDWIFQDIIRRWGALVEIISDNGKPFAMALGYIEKKYHIKHIRISGYNSWANSIIEQSHFDMWQVLFKVADSEQSKWLQVAYSAFWSECITPRHRMGCLPYFMVRGTHPLLPFDIIEANYLLPPLDPLLSMTNHRMLSNSAAETLGRLCQTQEVHACSLQLCSNPLRAGPLSNYPKL